MSDIILKKLEETQVNMYIKDIQASFQNGFERYFGKINELVIPDKDIYESLNAKGSNSYLAYDNDTIVGGVVVVINELTNINHLDILFIKVGIENKGYGFKIWNKIEELYPNTIKWQTCTPIFDERNVHFYVNKCGFNITGTIPEDDLGDDFIGDGGKGMYEFEKIMIKLINLSKSKYLVFDFDGVIVDSEKLYFKYWNEASISYGVNLTKEQLLSLRSADSSIASKVFGDFDLYTKIRTKTRELVANHLNGNMFTLKPNVGDTLKLLNESGYKIVIATSSSAEKVKKHLDYYGFSDYVSDIYSAHNLKRGKPYPDIYLEVCKHYELNPSDVCAIEDSPNGVKSAKTAGLNVIMIPDLSSPTEDDLKNTKLVIDDISKLKNIL